MKREHFTDEQIISRKKAAAEYNLWLIKKTVLKFKAGKERREMIKCMEHWKMWIAVKRLFKYTIEFGNANVQWGLCDIRWAFDKWRKADETISKGLGKKTHA